MMMTVETPWGEVLPHDAPDLFPMVFAWVHWQAGHRYVVTGKQYERLVVCACGEKSRGGSIALLPPGMLVRREPMEWPKDDSVT